jgi:glutathione synthase/RimK-type ligase-like ATP-grasp enzyme
MSVKILPYKTGSKSVKALCEALDVKALRLVDSKWKIKEDSVVINWGSSEFHSLHNITAPEGVSVKILNSPLKVREAVDKLKFFQLMKEFTVSLEIEDNLVPDFWTDKEYIPAGAYPIVCRTVLNGHSGEGIVIADTPDDLVDAPLYVRYMKKKKEFRIHVGKRYMPQTDIDVIGNPDPDYVFTVISEQQKVAKHGTEPTDWRIRSHDNGFIFQREGISVPPSARKVALRCLEATGLDFGAVDVVVTTGGQALALEINTAPGLTGKTVTDYANFFKGFI